MPRAWRAWRPGLMADPAGAPAQFDVIVVGAGIAGSALAVALSGEGLTLALVEAQPLPSDDLPTTMSVDDFDPRVSALTARSRRFLDDLGVWQAIDAYRSCAYRHMTVWDAQGTGQIEFDHREVDVPELGHIVENRAIVLPLARRLAAAPDITLFNPRKVEDCARQPDDTHVITLDDGTQLRSALVVAADGALSPIRTMLGFATREWDYGHRAIVATVQHECDHRYTAWQRFLPSGPLALLPLPVAGDSHFCSIVWSIEDALAEDILAQDDEAFCLALERASEGCLGAFSAASKRFAFPLRQRHAVDYVQPGVVLVADAAHTIHPLAGQGINLGLADVALLAQETLATTARGLPPGDLGSLQRYQRQRKSDNLVMMAAMDGFKRLFEADALPLRWLRNAGMRGVGAVAPVKQQLMRHAMGLGN